MQTSGTSHTTSWRGTLGSKQTVGTRHTQYRHRYEHQVPRRYHVHYSMMQDARFLADFRFITRYLKHSEGLQAPSRLQAQYTLKYGERHQAASSLQVHHTLQFGEGHQAANGLDVCTARLRTPGSYQTSGTSHTTVW